MSTIFVLGGAKSGKSAFAEKLCENLAHNIPGKKIYLATGQAHDNEMTNRIKAHQAQRNSSWQTIEAPLNIVETLQAYDEKNTVILLDCLTLWISNLMGIEYDFNDAFAEFLEQVSVMEATLVIVSNEVGQGIVPDNKLARLFRDQSGIAHQKIATLSNEVYFVTAGLPQKLKNQR